MPSRLKLLLAPVLLLFLASCGGGDPDLLGAYAGQTAEGPVALELKERGKGSWSTPEEDIAVAWERRGDEVWLHAKSGGVIICALGPDNTLAAEVPGVGRIVLSRKRP
ncbi:MAG: hypothetical protein AB1916_00120 [Thermodesulfobacteriota bacterium]